MSCRRLCTLSATAPSSSPPLPNSAPLLLTPPVLSSLGAAACVAADPAASSRGAAPRHGGGPLCPATTLAAAHLDCLPPVAPGLWRSCLARAIDASCEEKSGGRQALSFPGACHGAWEGGGRTRREGDLSLLLLWPHRTASEVLRARGHAPIAFAHAHADVREARLVVDDSCERSPRPGRQSAAARADNYSFRGSGQARRCRSRARARRTRTCPPARGGLRAPPAAGPARAGGCRPRGGGGAARGRRGARAGRATRA